MSNTLFVMCIILIVLVSCHYFVSNGKCIWYLIHTVMYKRSCVMSNSKYVKHIHSYIVIGECHCVVSNCKFVRYILHIVMFECHSSMYDSSFVRCSFDVSKEQISLNNLILKSQYRPTVRMFVYIIQVNPIHTILKYGICYDFMVRLWCSS